MVKFKRKVHKHLCEDCGVIVKCDTQLLHNKTCNSCHDKKVDRMFFGVKDA